MATKKPYIAQPTQTVDYDALISNIKRLSAGSVAEQAPADRGMLRGMADLGLEAASGAAKGIKFMSDVLGAGNPVSQGLQGVSDFAKELQSAQAKGEDQRIAQIMKAAEDKGIGEQVKSALQAAGEAPVRQAIGAIGTRVPMIAASMVPGLREASWGARAATLGGMGAAQGVGVVKSSMFDAVYQRAIEEGRGEQEARALAGQAQAYSAQNAGDIALGGALGAGAALTGFEPAAARAIGQTVTKVAQRGLMQSTLRGMAAESIPEAIQGGQEQVASNRAQQRAGFDTPTFRGAAGSATLEGVLSMPGGAVGGALDARGPKPLAPKDLGGQIRTAESVPESGPMTRAANQAVKAKAQQVELSAAAEGAALAGMEAQAQADLQGLRDFAGVTPNVVASMPTADQPPAAAPGAQPSAEFIDSPFSDRILTVQEMLADPATREQVRARWGDEGLGNIAYYAGVANRGGMPEKTQENLLGMAERLLQEAVLQPIQPASELGGQRPDPLLLGQAPAAGAPTIGMDASPSGRFTVDAQGNVAPESRVQAMDAQRRAEEAASLGKQAPGGQASVSEPSPAAAVDPLAIGMDTAPTGRMLAGQEGVRPETRMDAINIAQADMQRQAEAAQRAELGLTPDIEAVQQRNAMRPQDGDILNPSGKPFKTRMAVQRAAKKNPGEIVEVTGGFVIRPAATMATQQEVTGDEQGSQTAATVVQGPADGVPAAGDQAVPAAEAGQGGVLDAVSGQPGAAESAQVDAQGAGEQPVTPLTAQPNVEVPAEAASTPGAERGLPVAGAAGEPVEAAGVGQQAVVSTEAAGERFGGAPAVEPNQQVDNQPAAEAAQPQPAAVTITADDVAAAEKQAAQQIADRIDGMKAQEAQKIAARYLPTIGVKVPIGKARIKAAMTDAAGVNLLGPAGELGIELSDSVKQALTAKREGRIGMPAAEPAVTPDPAAQAAYQDPGTSPAVGQLAPTRPEAGRRTDEQQTETNQGATAQSEVQTPQEQQAPKLTPTQAKSLVEWQDLGQKDGIRTQILTFYGSQTDKEAKRGRMTMATVTKGDRSASAWMVEGDDQKFGMLAQAKKRAEELGMTRAVKDGYVEDGTPAQDTDKGVAMFSRSPMKSIDANIRRGLESLAKALDERTTVHRAMYRNSLGWVDFVWGDTGKVKPSGKTKGAMGISHIMEARNRKDGLSGRQTYLLLEGIVDAIASGKEVRRNEFQGSVTVAVEKNGIEALLTKKAGSNAWVISGWEQKNPVASAAGSVASAATSSTSTTARRGEGAGFAEIVRLAGSKVNPSMGLGMRGSGLSNIEAQSIAEAITTNWANAPEVVVAADMNDAVIPQAVRDRDAEQRSQGAQGEPEGFWYGGKVYLVSSALRTPGDAARVLLHEALGHHGLRGVFGSSFKPILQQIAAMRRAEVQAKADEYGLDMTDEAQRLQAAEEVLAVMAQTRPELGYVKRAIAAIRSWLRRTMPKLFSQMKLTDAEIIRDFLLPARRYVERGAKAGRETAVAFSRIQDQTKTEAFKRWYSSADGQVTRRNDAGGAGGSDKSTSGGAAMVQGGDADEHPVQRRGELARHVDWSDSTGRVTFDGASGPTGRGGAPVVFFHGTRDDFVAFRTDHPNRKDAGWLGRGVYGTSDREAAEDYSWSKRGDGEKRVMSLYFAVKNPYPIDEKMRGRLRYAPQSYIDKFTQKMKDRGHDGAVYDHGNGVVEIVAFEPTQVKSAIGNNGDFDPGNPDIRFSRNAAAKAYASQAMDRLNETFNHPGKLSWWHKTVGSMYNLAERMPAFKPVYDAAQRFINDVSFYAIEAADQAPQLLPRLENWSDLTKSPITAQDNKAVAAPVFEGTLSWRRDEFGKPVLVDELVKRYAGLAPEQKAQRLLRSGAITENVLKMWKGQPLEQYETSVNTAFEGRMLEPGIVFTPDELRSIFKLNDGQVALYQEFRRSVDASLDNMGKSDLLRVAGKDSADLRDAVMSAQDIDAAAILLRDHLLDLAKENPDRSDELATTANDMITRADKVKRLKDGGYAPLSRFGQYTVDVVVDGERRYFSMFETARDANRMASKFKMEFGAENVAQGTLSQREFEMLQGITPETLELFGNMLGLDSTGSQAQDQVFQEYLKRTKANRSAMKRLIHRKGIAGYSEDVGRVLAAFVYSNARQTSAALHMGDLGEAVMAIPKEEGELKDAAVELARYVKEPREEAAKMRGWLFAQYLGGSIASAIVNFTQPLTTSAPYLSQFGGMSKSVKALYQAMADLKDKKFEAGLAEAFRKRTEDGTLAPQGVHELMAQSRGEATLRTGDGTKVGDALARGRNALSKVAIGWGKLFGIAEQINRQSTYVAAYRMAAEQAMADPDAFAKKVVDETQFVNNKANKMKFGRGAVGATLMTFKSYSLNWLELFHRLATQNGREGKMAAAWMVGVLLLSAGASGLPFAEDAEDLADFLAQRLGYNWSSKKARQEFLEGLFGRDLAGLVENGVTGLPGSPIDVSGRLGMSNLLPGTGLLLKKKDHTSDFTEVLGPAGDLAKRTFQAADLLLSGNAKEAAFTIAPKAVGNLQKGVDMAQTGLYRDARGYKVDDATTGEAIGKAIGFQPRSVAQIQEASALNQRAKDFYRLKVEDINAKWAKAIFEKDSAAVDEVRAELKMWNRQNPEQRIQANLPAILRRVKEMRKSKADRIADTAPKAMRASMREEVRRMQEEMKAI